MSTQLIHCGAESPGSSLGCPPASAATQCAVLRISGTGSFLSMEISVGSLSGLLSWMLGEESPNAYPSVGGDHCAHLVLVPGVLGKDTHPAVCVCVAS